MIKVVCFDPIKACLLVVSYYTDHTSWARLPYHSHTAVPTCRVGMGQRRVCFMSHTPCTTTQLVALIMYSSRLRDFQVVHILWCLLVGDGPPWCEN